MTTDGVVFQRDVDLALLAGFVDPARVLGHQECKDAAGRLRARIVAVDLALADGPRVKLKVLGARLDVSERTLQRWFPVREAMFAFPPTELATALVGVGLKADSWASVPDHIHRLFAVLDVNEAGRRFLADLAAVRREHGWLRNADGYFAGELHGLMEANVHRTGGRAVAMVGYFTEGLRVALDHWAKTPHESIIAVAHAITELLGGRTLGRPAPSSGPL